MAGCSPSADEPHAEETAVATGQAQNESVAMDEGDKTAAESPPMDESNSSQEASGAQSDRPNEAPAQGVSWGGNLRGGPSEEESIVGRAPLGTKLAILENVGADRLNFPWFRVRTEQGMIAYIWGGILCAPSEDVPGTFTGEGCPAT